jgi:tripartite-type tricarboxylate transporter receptor subunit TctC
MLLKHLLSRCLVVVLAALAPAFASADSWPARPVRIIVPFAAGGATDVVARLLAQKLNEAWGQGVIVEDSPGAGGNIGADVAAKSNPDGYTLVMVSGSIVTANPFMYKSMPFDPAKDLAPITNVASGPQVIAVAKSVPAKTLRDFIAYVKANPGKLSYGSGGVGGITHVTAELFKQEAGGLDIQHVPYRGVAPALADLLGGQVQVVFTNLAPSIEYIKAGTLRALAVTTATRPDALPDIPTIGEFVSGYEASSIFGLGAPHGTPADIINTLNKEINAALVDPKFKAHLLDGAVLGGSPADFDKLLAEETEKWAKVIRTADIKPG